MVLRQSFGRRAAPQVTAGQPAAAPPAAAAQPLVTPLSPSPALPSIEEEIAAWKSARASAAPFPWRQFSLMAGLSFGIASFVLPQSVNDTMQWPLYALTAISFYAGLRKRKAN